MYNCCLEHCVLQHPREVIPQRKGSELCLCAAAAAAVVVAKTCCNCLRQGCDVCDLVGLSVSRVVQ